MAAVRRESERVRKREGEGEGESEKRGSSLLDLHLELPPKPLVVIHGLHRGRRALAIKEADKAKSLAAAGGLVNVDPGGEDLAKAEKEGREVAILHLGG